MKNMIQYEIWTSIEIIHEYYVNHNMPLLVTPDIETRLLFAKYNIIFRKQLTNQWILLRPADDLLPDKEKTIFRFELQIRSEEFYYSTDDYSVEPNGFFTMIEPDKPNVWKIMEIPYHTDIKEKNRSITLHIHSKQKYLEYILIPKYTQIKNIKLKLTEERGRIEFEGPETVILFGKTQVFRFVSKEAHMLRNTNDYMIRLWEIRSSGDKLLTQFIPYPRVGDISIIQPKNAITTYYYF